MLPQTSLWKIRVSMTISHIGYFVPIRRHYASNSCWGTQAEGCCALLPCLRLFIGIQMALCEENAWAWSRAGRFIFSKEQSSCAHLRGFMLFSFISFLFPFSKKNPKILEMGICLLLLLRWITLCAIRCCSTTSHLRKTCEYHPCLVLLFSPTFHFFKKKKNLNMTYSG